MFWSPSPALPGHKASVGSPDHDRTGHGREGDVADSVRFQSTGVILYGRQVLDALAYWLQVA